MKTCGNSTIELCAEIIPNVIVRMLGTELSFTKCSTKLEKINLDVLITKEQNQKKLN